MLFGGGAGFGGLAGGFGLGGSGAALVIIGLLLMAMAYFGLGFDGGGYGGGYAPYEMTGWLLVIASRLRSLLTDDL